MVCNLLNHFLIMFSIPAVHADRSRLTNNDQADN